MIREEDKILHTLDFVKMLHMLQSQAQTSIGKQCALELLPSSSLTEVQQSLTLTDEAVTADRLKGQAPLGGITDTEAALKRSRIGSMLAAAELVAIASTSRSARRLRKWVHAIHESTALPLLTALANQLGAQKPLEDEIWSCIDEDGIVMDRASMALAEVRRDIRSTESRVREKLDSMIRSTSVQKMLQDTLVTMRGDRYVLPVQAAYRASFGGIVHDQSSSGQTLFIEPEAVVQLNNKLRELKAAELREVERILARLTAEVALSADVLIADLAVLAQLDLVFAKVRLAHALRATLPHVNDRGYIRIKQGRHPLIAPHAIVPIDIEFGTPQVTSIIVTGPNTGGKTVSLKTVGLLSLMAMSGLFVPAAEGTELAVFEGIYADIGDEQSIEQSLSTFSSHMTNIIRILGELNSRSLVLLDELGAGTDPAEGSALAIAILDHIHRSGARLLATTHYSELKAYAYNRDGMTNASMEFDVQTLSPTYRLLVGVPGRSNAFAIAERLGLSRTIIDAARGEVSDEDLRVDSMIASLETDRRDAQQELAHVESLRAKLEGMQRDYEARQAKFDEQREKLLAEARAQASEVLARAEQEAAVIIADLKKLAAEEGAAVKQHKLIDMRRRLEDAKPAQPQAKKRSSASQGQLAIGDQVIVLSLNQRGHIVEMIGKEAQVQLGIMKMKVALADLELYQRAAKEAQPKLEKSATTLKRTRDDHAKLELDLRGTNVEEAIIEVDRYLDEAFLANFPTIYLIHGKGTGVLRAGVTEFIRKHKHVKSFRLGAYNEGGSGVTVVELK